MPTKKLQSLAASKGARFEDDRDNGVFYVHAPEGKVFSGGSHSLVQPYENGPVRDRKGAAKKIYEELEVEDIETESLDDSLR